MTNMPNHDVNMTGSGRRVVDGRDGVVYSSRMEWGYYSNGHAVRVVAPGDPFTGEVGLVQRTFLDGGDIVHFVRFCTGHTGSLCHTGYYPADELRSAEVKGRTKHQPTEQES